MTKLKVNTPFSTGELVPEHQPHTKTSELRLKDKNQDKKADAGKPLAANGALLKFPRAMLEVAKASEIGLVKYDVPLDDKNYQGSSYLRYLDPLCRHLIGHELEVYNVEKGGKLPEEGVTILHLSQAAWCALAALENYLIEMEEE